MHLQACVPPGTVSAVSLCSSRIAKSSGPLPSFAPRGLLNPAAHASARDGLARVHAQLTIRALQRELEAQNAQLERRVRERTAEL